MEKTEKVWKSTLVRLKEFFEMGTSEFAKEWAQLADQSKKDLRHAIESDTFTY